MALADEGVIEADALEYVRTCRERREAIAGQVKCFIIQFLVLPIATTSFPIPPLCDWRSKVDQKKHSVLFVVDRQNNPYPNSKSSNPSPLFPILEFCQCRLPK